MFPLEQLGTLIDSVGDEGVVVLVLVDVVAHGETGDDGLQALELGVGLDDVLLVDGGMSLVSC